MRRVSLWRREPEGMDKGFDESPQKKRIRPIEKFSESKKTKTPT